MLREVPGFSSPAPEMTTEPITTSDLHDDIFGSEPGSPVLSAQEGTNEDAVHDHDLNAANSERSDIPRLRSTHVTNGYRDGISVSKAEHVQSGFDEGFSLGAVLGLKAGFLLGVLEGIVRAISSASTTNAEVRNEVIELFIKAREDLGLKRLFSSEWFGEDGIWKFEVEGGESEVTFRDVADGHPLIREWTEEVESLKQKFGIEIKARPRDEGEDEEEVRSS